MIDQLNIVYYRVHLIYMPVQKLVAVQLLMSGCRSTGKKQQKFAIEKKNKFRNVVWPALNIQVKVKVKVK